MYGSLPACHAHVLVGLRPTADTSRQNRSTPNIALEPIPHNEKGPQIAPRA